MPHSQQARFIHRYPRCTLVLSCMFTSACLFVAPYLIPNNTFILVCIAILSLGCFALLTLPAACYLSSAHKNVHKISKQIIQKEIAHNRLKIAYENRKEIINSLLTHQLILIKSWKSILHNVSYHSTLSDKQHFILLEKQYREQIYDINAALKYNKKQRVQDIEKTNSELEIAVDTCIQSIHTLCRLAEKEDTAIIPPLPQPRPSQGSQ